MLSFCLEDGSRLFASFEPKTVFKSNKTSSEHNEFFPPPAENFEMPVHVPVKNSNLNFDGQPNVKFIVSLIILSFIWFSFIVAAAYTGSFVPLLVALVITLIYKVVLSFIK
jgi:hypothetical protein